MTERSPKARRVSQWYMSRWRLYSIVVEAAIAWLAFFADPFGLMEQKTRALNDYLAVATQYLHGPAPKDVAVVLVDSKSLRERGVDWPLPYDAVADLIGELRCARVKGVFFDFTASREFTSANPEERLRGAVEGESKTRICADGSAPADAPVFFGRVEGFETPVGRWLREGGRTFLFAAGEDAGVYRASKDLFPAQAVPIEEATPAFGILRMLDLWPAPVGISGNAPCADGDERPRCWRAPLSLIWSARIDPAQSQVSDLAKCRGDKGWFGTLTEMPWPWAGDDRFERCPPVLTLRAADLERDADYIEAHGDPTKPLAGRFVFVGADLAALNDRVATPIHDHLPGVLQACRRTRRVDRRWRALSDVPATANARSDRRGDLPRARDGPAMVAPTPQPALELCRHLCRQRRRVFLVGLCARLAAYPDRRSFRVLCGGGRCAVCRCAR